MDLLLSGPLHADYDGGWSADSCWLGGRVRQTAVGPTEPFANAAPCSQLPPQLGWWAASSLSPRSSFRGYKCPDTSPSRPHRLVGSVCRGRARLLRWSGFTGA